MTEFPPLPEPVGTFYVDENTGRWSQYRNAPAVLTDGDARFFDAEAMRAYAAEAVRVALEDAAADLAQAVCDDCENGVQWLNLAASAKFAKDYPHLRAAITALGDTK